MTKKKWVGVFGVLTLVTAAAILLFFVQRPQDLTDILRQEFGMVRIRPPGRTTGPGTIVSLESETGRGASLRPLCTREQSYGSLLRDPQRSNTIGITSAGSGRQTLELEEGALADAKAEVETLQAIELQLQNASVLSYSAADLIGLNAQRTVGCQTSIDASRSDVFVIQSVLEADVVYHVNLAAGTGLDASVAKKLALALGSDTRVTDDQRIQGTNLYWGVSLLPIKGAHTFSGGDGPALLSAKDLERLAPGGARVLE